ncbi:TRAP transporter substrate-binding protein DctP [Alcanivorax sp. JB21]|nr:TRAP transporter substrate-binding protein DctP [Alcanivorax limicola]
MLRLFTACVLLLPLSAAAMEFKISTLYPDGTAAVNRLKEAGKQLEKETDGRVSLRIYAGGTMGDDRAVQRRIRIGQLHGSLAQAGAFASSYKDSQILNLPLAFRSLDEVDHVRAELDPLIRDGFEDNGWVVFGPMDGGFAYLMSRNPVASVSDLQRQKVWLPAGDTGSAMAAREFGISPVVLNLGAVLTSLQTGVIDAFAAPAVPALTLQWYTRVSHFTEMPLLYTYGVLALGKQHVERLSDEDQVTLRRVLSEAAADLDNAERAGNRRAMEALRGQGLEPVEPNAEQLREWRTLARQATDRLVEGGEISEDMLARLNALLDEYRGD